MSELLTPLFRTTELAAIFAPVGQLQAMLDVEAALARAEAALGIIPAAAVPPIAAACRAELFDVASLARAAALAGNLAIPLVRQLAALVERSDGEAQRFVHWGATSQDILDTAQLLQVRRLLDEMAGDLDRLAGSLAELADRQRATPMIGRTWLQQALPVTFGLKAAGWLDAVLRHQERLRELRPRLLVVQFGGAAGTLASLGGRGPEVVRALAGELDLGAADLPWHGNRDRIAELACWLGLLAGSLGKIARDLALLAQTEVGEVLEPTAAGRGGSSTMPHKRNPVTAAVVLAAATRAPGLVATILSAMPQEHERGLGGWQAEWETLPELALLVAGVLRHLAETMPGIELAPERMLANLELTRGLVMAEAVQMALGATLGRQAAHDLIERACRRSLREGRHLRDVLADQPEVAGQLDRATLDRLFEPRQHADATASFIDNVLARHRRRQGGDHA